MHAKRELGMRLMSSSLPEVHCIRTCTHMDKKKEGSVLAEIVYAFKV